MSGDAIEYRCTHCKRMFLGINSGYVVAGLRDGTLCSTICLMNWANEALLLMGREMERAFWEHEHGGNG